MKHKYAIIVAGGSGTRMGSQLPKQFITIGDKPILYYTIQSFLDAYPDLEVIIVLPKDYLEVGQELLKDLDNNRIIWTAGGITRFHSVQNGLKYIKHKDSIVFVHDGVRCMVNKELIQRCYEDTLNFGNAVPAVNATDSIRIMEGDNNKSVDREKVFIIQTPQTFRSDILLDAFKKEYNPLFTDEASVVETNGIKIHLTEGDHQNIKVTRPIDLILAEHFLKHANRL